MRFVLDPRKLAMVMAGLLVGAGTVAFAASDADARDFIGLDLGPVSVGIGPYAPDYYVPPSVTYVDPSATTVYPVPASPPAVYEAPTTTYYYSAPGYYMSPGTVIVP